MIPHTGAGTLFPIATVCFFDYDYDYVHEHEHDGVEAKYAGTA